MSEEYSCQSNHPLSETQPDTPLVVTALSQVLAGLPVGLSYRYVRCTDCQCDLQEGQSVTV